MRKKRGKFDRVIEDFVFREREKVSSIVFENILVLRENVLFCVA